MVKKGSRLGDGGVKETEKGKEEGKMMEFRSLEEERGWLKGALTGRLKEEFLWKFHGEDLQNECWGKLKISDLGDRMILIQSQTDKTTEEMIEGLKEWEDFWLEWRRPWKSRDVNQRRLVWTKWSGVPLQAWSRRFFSWVSAEAGRVVEVHESTESRTRLDAAFVRILTGLHSFDRVKSVKVDGESFNIRMEEVGSMENEFQSCRIDGCNSDSDYVASEEVGSLESISPEKGMGRWTLSAPAREGGERERRDASVSPTHAVGVVEIETSNYEKSPRRDHEVGGGRDLREHEDNGGEKHLIGRDGRPSSGLDSGGPSLSTIKRNGPLSTIKRKGPLYFGINDSIRSEEEFGLEEVELGPSNGGGQPINTNSEVEELDRDRVSDSIQGRGETFGDSGKSSSMNKYRKGGEGLDSNASRGKEDGRGGARSKGVSDGEKRWGVECWDFGKQLGLKAKEGEDKVIRALAGIETAGVGLGGRGDTTDQ